jgi:hypothetical protein
MALRKAFDALFVLVMVATLAAVVSMAFLSAYMAHPDEKDHVGAGQYYMQYWDPPKVGDARARAAYSNYGVSYLDQLDAVYFLAGKFACLVKPFVGQDYLALRLFNVALLALLMVLAWRLPSRLRIVFLPLLISPQPWYVFSYFNADALPLALSFIAAYFLTRLLDDRPKGGPGARAPQSGRPGAWRLAWLGLTLGLLAISKQNYYVFLVFFACFWLGLAWLGLDRGKRTASLKQAGLVFAMAAAIFGARYGAHVWVVRHQPPDAVAKVAEQLAADEFKPSKQAEGKGFWGMNMRAQGVTFTQMFTGEWKWHVFTFRSSFGKYGAMDIEPPLIFYRYIGWMLEAFLAVMLVALLRNGPAGRMTAALFVLFAILTVLQSVWHSWTADFQAQGRYLFPILGMLACALPCCQEVPGRVRQALWIVGGGMWGMSIWSFVAVGLARIPR